MFLNREWINIRDFNLGYERGRELKKEFLERFDMNSNEGHPNHCLCFLFRSPNALFICLDSSEKSKGFLIIKSTFISPL